MMWGGGLVAGIVWLVRSVARQPASSGSARRLADERFTAGELSVDEHRRTPG